mmetsp:Transcript_24545/g.42010  ORF Transcript_24545/g.42010 Transcript_24545/m.42010 type:complete len:518 (+) Transcript_24545:117-1670(+)
MNISSTPSSVFQHGIVRNSSIIEGAKTEVAGPRENCSGDYSQSNGDDDDDDNSVESALFDVAIVISEDTASVCPLPLISVELPLDPTSLCTTAPTSAIESRSSSASTVTALKGGAAVPSKVTSTLISNTASAYPRPSPKLISPKSKRRKLCKASDRQENTGRWSTDEHKLFLRGLEVYGRGGWKEISSLVCTRTPTQVRTHAKKYFIKMAKEGKTMQRDQVEEVGSRSNNFRDSPVIPADDERLNVDIGKTAVTDVRAFRSHIPDKQDQSSLFHPYCGQVGLDIKAARPSQFRRASVVSLDTQQAHTREVVAYSPNRIDVTCDPFRPELKTDCQNVGNERLRDMLDSRIQDYKKANLVKKHAIARDVVASIMDDASSQLLQQDKASGVYKPVPIELATFRVMSLLDKITQVADGEEKRQVKESEEGKLNEAFVECLGSHENKMGSFELHGPRSVAKSLVGLEEMEEMGQELNLDIVHDGNLECDLGADLGADYKVETDLESDFEDFGLNVKLDKMSN